MAIGGSLQLTNKDRHFIKMHKKNTKRFEYKNTIKLVL